MNSIFFVVYPSGLKYLILPIQKNTFCKWEGDSYWGVAWHLMRLLYIFETKVIQIVIYLNPITPYLSILYSFTHNFMFIHTYRGTYVHSKIFWEKDIIYRYRYGTCFEKQKSFIFFNRHNFLTYGTLPYKFPYRLIRDKL